MAMLNGTVGLSLSVEVEVVDPTDDDEVEEAFAAAGVKALREEYGIDVRPKDVVIFNDGCYEDD
jgi:hypothetical protein